LLDQERLLTVKLSAIGENQPTVARACDGYLETEALFRNPTQQVKNLGASSEAFKVAAAVPSGGAR
jgi:hypothetical protein